MLTATPQDPSGTGIWPIVETTCNRLFRVRDAGPGLDHVWLGTELNRRTGEPKKGAREVPVRRAGCRVVREG